MKQNIDSGIKMKLRLLTIGTKFGATWLEAAKHNPHWEIAGAVARSEISLKEVMKKFNIDKDCLFTDVDSALSKVPNVDAVVVAVPNQFHYEIARKVLEYNYHLILEKPITENWAQAIDLVKLVDSHHKKSCVGQTLRGEIMLRLMEIRLREGLIGNLEQLTFKSHWNWIGDPETQWRFRLENMFLDDIGIHQIDTIRMLLQNRKAIEVFATNYTPKSYPNQKIKTSASGLILMEDDIRVNYYGSMGNKGENIGWYGDISIFGSKGSMHRGAYGEPYYILETQKKKIGMDCDDIDRIIPFFDYEKIDYLLEDFYHAITENRAPVTDLHDNINSHAILLAMKKSAAEKRIIYVQDEYPVTS